MRRREFMALAVSAGLASIVKASAQPPERIRRVGMLMNGVAANGTAQSYVQTFVQGLKSLGWIENENIHIDQR
jgi:hypothetical protein